MNYGYKIGEINAKVTAEKITKKILITTQLIYWQIISVKTNLTYRTYGLLTTNQSSYLKQEIKFKRNLTGLDSFTYPLFHSFIYSLFHSFIHSFVYSSFTLALIHFSLLYTDMLSCFLTNLYDFFLTKEFQTYFLPNINKLTKDKL